MESKVIQRFDITDGEGEKLLEICNHFYESYSRAFARAMLRCPSKDLYELLMMKLQEQCSSPKYVNWSFEDKEWKITVPTTG